MKKIALCMIVKDEAAIIERCLDSVRPLVDFVLVEDTGSTDGTQQVINGWLQRHQIAGQVFDEPWRDFAYNRTRALEELRKNPAIGYALIIDADDFIVYDHEFDVVKFKEELSADQYSVELRESGIRYDRPQLCRNDLPFRYRGVLHEFLESPPGASWGRADGFHIESRREGARSRDPNKYRNDAELLERALVDESDPHMRARYTFYLGQSYRDCGDKEKAVAAFMARAELGFWNQEVYLSLYYAAQLQGALEQPFETVFATYQRAIEAAPERAEARHGACRLCRIAGRNQEGYEVGKPGLTLTPPGGALFLESWTYDHGLLDEFSINAYWAGHYRDSLDACLRLLGENKFPAHERSRIFNNARFAIDKLKDVDPAALDLLIAPAGKSAASAFLPEIPTAASGPNLPSVTVITPTGGRAGFLAHALEFFRRQDYPHLEWLILDDSAEPNAAFVDLRDANIHYRHYAGPRLTVGEKRNRLVASAQSEIIVHFDDDDFYAPHYVSRMVNALTANDADLINLRGWHLFDQRSGFFGYWDLMQKEGLHHRCDQAGVSILLLNSNNNRSFENNHFGFGFSYAYKKTVWEKSKFPSKDFNEDGEFALQAATCFKVAGVYDTTAVSCLHVLHIGSSSRCFPQYRLPNFQLAEKFPDAASLLVPQPVADAEAPATRPARQIQATLTALPSKRPAAPATPIFIHATWRTSSTWFWSRFRSRPETMSYFEPFAELTVRLARGNVSGNLLRWGPKDWKSNHPQVDPYFLEYQPLLRRAGGVRLYDERMAYAWSMPVGGLGGELRPAEQRYLALLLRHAVRGGKVPVFGFVRSLGRLGAIKRSFGGIHLFQYRNLWRHWMSYVAYKRDKTPFFYNTVPLVIANSSGEDAYIGELCDRYLQRSIAANGLRVDKPPGRHQLLRALEALPESDAFALFMGLHIYLYLHAKAMTDLAIDVTRTAREEVYRGGVEEELAHLTGLPISLSDVTDVQKPVEFDVAAIDWKEIAENAHAAVSSLDGVADPEQLTAFASELIERTYSEARGGSSAPFKGKRAPGPAHEPGSDRNPSPANISSSGKTETWKLPPIHLINLDRSTDRLRRFTESNSHLRDVIRVSATDGYGVDREALIRSGYITNDVPYAAGTLGCAMSHVKLWEKAVAEDRSITIFEDDVVVSRHFEKRVREALALIPDDWDLVKWGYLYHTSFIWVDLGVSKARLEGYGSKHYRSAEGYAKFQAEDCVSAPLRMLHSFGFQGYTISPRGARAALEFCLPLRKRLIHFPEAGVVTEDKGIDIALSGSYPLMKAYLCIPPLVIYRDDEASAREATDEELQVAVA